MQTSASLQIVSLRTYEVYIGNCHYGLRVLVLMMSTFCKLLLNLPTNSNNQVLIMILYPQASLEEVVIRQITYSHSRLPFRGNANACLCQNIG